MTNSNCDCGATPENRWPHHDDCGLYNNARNPLKHGPTGMITKSSELFTGLEYYHVYGHINRNSPTKYTVVERPKKNHADSDFLSFKARSHYNGFISEEFCGDCGLDDVNHNHNRIFYDVESANRFILKCIREGVRKL